LNPAISNILLLPTFCFCQHPAFANILRLGAQVMARGFVDELSTAAPIAPVAVPQPAVALARPILLAALAVGAALGLVAVLGASLVFGAPIARAPELVRLLHLMVGIKALIFSVAAVLVFRRLARPVQGRALLGYATGLGLSAGALGWLWSLTALLPGALLFYGGLLTTYLTASRDPGLFAGLRRVH
jgi:hypothetical protein